MVRPGSGRAAALIREYRTRLIADVVTGKVDVRGAAASLPAELDDEEAAALDEWAAEMEEGEAEDEAAIEEDE